MVFDFRDSHNLVIAGMNGYIACRTYLPYEGDSIDEPLMVRPTNWTFLKNSTGTASLKYDREAKQMVVIAGDISMAWPVIDQRPWDVARIMNVDLNNERYIFVNMKLMQQMMKCMKGAGMVRLSLPKDGENLELVVKSDNHVDAVMMGVRT